MARLNVAVEAAHRKATEQYDIVLSVYVTDENREPVSGLKQKDFAIKWLVPLAWSGGEFAFFDLSGEIEPSGVDLPGVYQLKIANEGSPYGNTIGVRVKRAPKLPGGIGGPLVQDKGFGMATAIRCE